MSKHSLRGLIALACVYYAVLGHAQSYKQQVNAEHSGKIAHGQNAIVVQVEPPSAGADGKSSAYHYGPNQSHANYKSLDIRIDPSAKASKHSEAVGQLFFGKRRSIAEGIERVYIFSSFQWMRDLAKWDFKPSTAMSLFPGPVVNHSWAMGSPNTGSSELLKRVELSTYSNNIVHVTGVRKRGIGQPLLSGGYNIISVGGAHKNIETPYAEINQEYQSGRFRPHLIGPFPHSSAAVPVVGAAVVRLNALAHHLGLVVDASRYNNPLLPAELTRAILMASASPDFSFRHQGELLVNKFGAMGATTSGMDKRYGMGMLNMRAAEDVLREGAGKKYQANKAINGSGFVYHRLASDQLHYTFEVETDTQFSTTLSWLAEIEIADDKNLNLVLADFDLCLFEQTTAGLQIVAESLGANDSVENIRAALKPGRSYQLVVVNKNETSLIAPIALAWSLAPHQKK